MEEGFETSIIPGELPNGWTTIDADGDGLKWDHSNVFPSHDGLYYVTSASFDWDLGGITPDNYLVSPQVDLPNGGTLTFWICAQDENSPAEHFGVYASTTGTAVEDFGSALLEGTLTAKGVNPADKPTQPRSQGAWYYKTVNLPKGTKYIAIRHFDCNNQFWMNVDDVTITDQSSEVIQDYTYTVHRDGILVGEGVVDPMFVEEYLQDGTYEYCVKVKYPTDESVSVCVSVTVEIGPNPYIAVINLQGTADANGNMTLSWTAPEADPEHGDYTYLIYRNGLPYVLYYEDTTFTQSALAEGTYDYCIYVAYQIGGFSDAVCTSVEVVPTTVYTPVSQFTAELINQDVNLSWLKPAGRSEVLLEEGFEDGFPAGWKRIDADGDSNNWQIFTFVGHNSEFCISSASYLNQQGALLPDNYLITPKLTLPEGGKLIYAVSAQDSEWAAEHYSVLASKTGNNASDFTEVLWEEDLTSKAANPVASPNDLRDAKGMRPAQGAWLQRSVKIPAGTNYIAFRHYNVTDMYWINLDNIRIENLPYDITHSYTLYRDGVVMADALSELSYVDKNVAPGTRKYGVQVKYSDGGLSPIIERSIDVLTSLEAVDGSKPYSLQLVGKTLSIECNGQVSLYDLNGRRLADSAKQLKYTAQTGVYLARIVVAGVIYIEKVQIP